jgi:hypothetical protein
LLGALSHYALNLSSIELGDENLARLVDRLRSILKAVYGQRLTFRGEEREPTDTRVTIDQAVRELQGRMTGYHGPVLPDGLAGSVVAKHGEQDVASAAGETDERGVVAFTLGAFAVL